ncbi:MAG: uroporphyrinogen-III synthase [Geminicoccaceae bacterium]
MLRGEVEKLGFEAAIESLLDILPLRPAMPRLDDVQAIVLTSRHAAPALAERAGLPRIYAVGESTAAAARTAGCRDVVTSGGNVRNLSRLLIESCRPCGGTILHLSGEVVRRGLKGTLEEHGFDYQRLVVYRAVERERYSVPIEAAWRARAFGAVLLFSPRTAEILVRLLCQSGLEGDVDSTAAICLSDETAAPCRVLNWRCVHVATRPDRQALLEALVDSSTI